MLDQVVNCLLPRCQCPSCKWIKFRSINVNTPSKSVLHLLIAKWANKRKVWVTFIVEPNRLGNMSADINGSTQIKLEWLSYFKQVFFLVILGIWLRYDSAICSYAIRLRKGKLLLVYQCYTSLKVLFIRCLIQKFGRPCSMISFYQPWYLHVHPNMCMH